VLRVLPTSCATSCAREDVFVRYGGEAFCLLLPTIPGPGAVALAGRIRRPWSGTFAVIEPNRSP
jgi:PleD family two-component response regulator